MKFLSQIFQPIITTPKNAKVKSSDITCISQKLLVECGLVHANGSGLYTLLPLARRALDKLESLVRSAIESTGAQRISLPSLTRASLWERSGRLQESGPELMHFTDRHDKDYILSPTHEEAVADMLGELGPLSYKQLPLQVYQIGPKYRDEHRPKHGLMRAREFLMMDGYGGHESLSAAMSGYTLWGHAYRTLFHKLQLQVHRVQAPSGEMGGSLSHEWHVPSVAGEDTVATCTLCHVTTLPGEGGERGERCAQCGGSLHLDTTIEVGHTFVLGTKYSEAMNANYTPSKGPPQPLMMCCYGIGVTRLLAACVEVSSSELGLRWPLSIAPYTVLLVGPKEGSHEWSSGGWDRVLTLGRQLASVPSLVGDILIDDRHHMTIGKRLLQADRMGYPCVVICGKSDKYEVLRPGPPSPGPPYPGPLSPGPQYLTLEELISELTGHQHTVRLDDTNTCLE